MVRGFFARLMSRIRYWVIERIFSWDEWWNRNTPTSDPLYTDSSGKVDKDERYWKLVAGVIANKPFINEFAELQQRYQKHITEGMIVGVGLKKIRDYQLILYGMRKVNGIITSAHNKLLKDKGV